MDWVQEDLSARELACQTLKARDKGDKRELRRILGHLPMVIEGRQARHSGTAEAASVPAEGATECLGSAGPTTPRASASNWKQPPLTPRLTTPRLTPRDAVKPGSSAGPIELTPASVVQPLTTGQVKVLARTTGLSKLAAAEFERQKAFEQAKMESTLRHKERLAEIGVDPSGLSAADILSLYWTRADGGGTTYMRMTAKAGRDLEVRAATPRCIAELATARGHQEVRKARDVYPERVHECLDKWEIDKLADVCRTSRNIMDAAGGTRSLYTTSFGPRTKQFPRPPVPV